MPAPDNNPIGTALFVRLSTVAQQDQQGFLQDLTPGDADDWSIFQHNFTVWLLRNPDVITTGKVRRSDPPPKMPKLSYAD